MSVLVRLNRRGATLPLGIIVLAVMSVAVAITYARISSERVIVETRPRRVRTEALRLQCEHRLAVAKVDSAVPR